MQSERIRGAARTVALAAAMLLPLAAAAYESDVHFGLTRWLALKAGFGPSEATAVALGNQRVDAGLMDTLALSLEYACTGKYPEVALQVQRQHFPSAKPVPARPEDRQVVPGSEAARKDLQQLAALWAGKEGLLLGKLGETLHPLQDSWAHRGVPDAPATIGGLACNPELLSLHPAARGGSASHAADLTAGGAADVAAMARVTYDVLLAFPPINGRKRTAAAWDALRAPLDAFVKAGSKTAKRQWFVGEGFDDTSFLEGISLPDGADPGPLHWAGRRLPVMPVNVSNQHEVQPELRAFFDQLMTRWLGGEKVESLLAEIGPEKPSAELAARMKLWKFRDHGSAAAIVHARAPLSGAVLRKVDQLTRDPKVFVQTANLAEVVFPLQALAPYATPLLPYVTSTLPAVAGGPPRAAAILRFRHAPYDSVALIAQKRGDRWTLVELVAVVDH